MTLLARTSADTGYAAIDRYTPVRATLGLTAGLLGVPPWVVALGYLGWQAARHGWYSSSEETLANQATDLVVTIAGYYAGRRLRAHPAVLPVLVALPFVPP